MTFAKALTIILLIVALAVVAVFLMGRFEQTKPYYDQITGTLSNVKDKITSFMSNPMAAVGTLGTAIGGVAGILTVYKYFQPKLSEATSQLSQATSQANDLSTKLSSQESTYKQQITQQLTAQKSTLETQTKTAIDQAVAQATSQSNAKVVELTNLNTNLLQQRNDLQAQYNTLQTKYSELKSLVPK